MLKNFGWIREETISKLGPRTIRTFRHLERSIQTNWYAGSRNRLVPRLPTNEHSPLTSRVVTLPFRREKFPFGLVD